MGIILAALAAAGDSGVDSINQNMKQQNALDLDTHRSQLEVQKAVAVENAKNTIADTQRDQLADRVGQSDEQNEANTLANAKRSSQYIWVPANTVLNADGTAPEGTQTIDPTMADLNDEDKQTYKSTPRQILMDEMNNAHDSGDYEVAGKIAQTLQAGKIQTGYGGTTTDSLDIDPETGDPRVIKDNTTGAQAIKQQNADAATTRAARPTGRGGSNEDYKQSQLLAQAAHEARMRLQSLQTLQAANPTRPGTVNPYDDQVNAAKDTFNAAVAKRDAQLAKHPTSVPTNAPSAAKSPSGKDYSNLW